MTPPPDVQAERGPEDGAPRTGPKRRRRGLTVCKFYVDPPGPPEVMLERAFDAYCRLVLHGVLKLAQERRDRKRQGEVAPAA